VNRIHVMCLCLLVVAVEAMADFKMPKKVYRMDRLEEAKTKAKAKGKAIAIIFTHEKTSCGLCAAASLKAAQILGRKTVVVYADCDTEKQKLPVAAQQALGTPEAGRFVPKTVILDAELETVLALVPYAKGKEQNRLFKDAIKKLPRVPPQSGRVQKPASNPGMLAFRIPPADDREFRTWQPASSVPIEAALVHERRGRITLKKKNGTKVEILSLTLCKEDQNYIQQIRNESSNKPDAGDGK